MKKALVAIVLLTAVIAAIFLGRQNTQATALTALADGASYTPDGKLQLPVGYRKWVFIGAPLTPNGLNEGWRGFRSITMFMSKKKTCKLTSTMECFLKERSL